MAHCAPPRVEAEASVRIRSPRDTIRSLPLFPVTHHPFVLLCTDSRAHMDNFSQQYKYIICAFIFRVICFICKQQEQMKIIITRHSSPPRFANLTDGPQVPGARICAIPLHTAFVPFVPCSRLAAATRRRHPTLNWVLLRVWKREDFEPAVCSLRINPAVCTVEKVRDQLMGLLATRDANFALFLVTVQGERCTAVQCTG